MKNSKCGLQGNPTKSKLKPNTNKQTNKQTTQGMKGEIVTLRKKPSRTPAMEKFTKGARCGG